MRKSIYVDGHERPDVIKEREDFIKAHDELHKQAVQFDPVTLEEIPNAEAKYVFVSMDEKGFQSNEVQTR